jgi:hypothetical protein
MLHPAPAAFCFSGLRVVEWVNFGCEAVQLVVLRKYYITKISPNEIFQYHFCKAVKIQFTPSPGSPIAPHAVARGENDDTASVSDFTRYHGVLAYLLRE